MKYYFPLSKFFIQKKEMSEIISIISSYDFDESKLATLKQYLKRNTISFDTTLKILQEFDFDSYKISFLENVFDKISSKIEFQTKWYKLLDHFDQDSFRLELVKLATAKLDFNNDSLFKIMESFDHDNFRVEATSRLLTFSGILSFKTVAKILDQFDSDSCRLSILEKVKPQLAPSIIGHYDIILNCFTHESYKSKAFIIINDCEPNIDISFKQPRNDSFLSNIVKFSNNILNNCLIGNNNTINTINEMDINNSHKRLFQSEIIEEKEEPYYKKPHLMDGEITENDIINEKQITRNKETLQNECGICNEYESNALLLPCRHSKLCLNCAWKSKQTNSCPFCRSQITNAIKIF